MYDSRKFFESNLFEIDHNLEATSADQALWDTMVDNICKTIIFEETLNQFEEAKMMENHILEKYNKDWRKLP